MDELRRLIDSAQYAEVIRRFDARQAQGALSAVDMAHGYHLVSIAYFWTQDLLQAQVCAEQAAELAGTIGDAELQLRAWANLIAYARHQGNYDEALTYGEKWFANLHRAPGEAVRQGNVHYNLGLVYRHRQKPEEALRRFLLALKTAGESLSEFRLTVLLMTAWLCYEIRRTGEADQFADEAAALLRAEGVPPHLQREYLLLQAWRAYHVGGHWQCIPLCEDFLQDDATEHQRFWAATMIASCALQLYPADKGRVEELKRLAMHHTDVCGQLALSIREPRLINLCNSLRKAVHARWCEDLAV